MKLRNLLIIAAAILGVAGAPALADLTYTQGAGTTIFDFLCFTSKHCSAHVTINSAGTEIAVATSTKQPALGTAGASSTDVLSVQGIASGTALPVSGTFWQATQPVSAASWPLPTGAATEATLSTLNAKVPALGQALAAASVPVILPAATITTLTPPAAITGFATSTKQSDGSHKTQIVDGSGSVIASTSNNLNVQCANCSGSGVSTADAASFTASTSLFAGTGGFFQTTATNNALTNGQQGMLQLTANRAAFVNLRNASGAELGVAAAPVQVSLANTAANATAVKVDGSAVTQPVSLASVPSHAVTNAGTFATQSAVTAASGAYAAGALASGAGVDGWDLTQGAKADSAWVSGSGSLVAIAKTIAGNTGAAVPAGTARIGYTSDDPCTQKAKTNLPISQNGTSSVQLIALSGSTVIYVCSLSLIAAGATTVAITTGTGTACVTGNAAVIGSTTANIANSMSLAANGGLTLGSGHGTVAQGAASSELCMILGTNVFVSGNLTYVQQ